MTDDIMMEKEDEIDLLELLFAILNKIGWVIGTALAFAIIAAGVTKFAITPMYSSTAELYILSSSTSLTSLADIQIGTSLTKDYVQLIQSRPVVEQVISNLNLDRSYSEVLENMEFKTPSDTRILMITAEDPDPELAKALVDEFAEVGQKRISGVMKTDEPSIFQYGYVAEYPVSPSLLKNTAIGGLAGAVLAMAVIVVLFLLNDSIKTADDVQKYLGLNTLTSIPLEAGLDDSGDSMKKKNGLSYLKRRFARNGN